MEKKIHVSNGQTRDWNNYYNNIESISSKEIFTFGKYNGRKIKDIMVLDAQYVKWAQGLGLIQIPRGLKL